MPAVAHHPRRGAPFDVVRKKLSLNLDELRVESFSTDENAGERGTVAGHLGDTGDGCSVFYSCVASACGATCDVGCNASGAYTCGHYSRCNGDSVNICWGDWCP